MIFVAWGVSVMVDKTPSIPNCGTLGGGGGGGGGGVALAMMLEAMVDPLVDFIVSPIITLPPLSLCIIPEDLDEPLLPKLVLKFLLVPVPPVVVVSRNIPAGLLLLLLGVPPGDRLGLLLGDFVSSPNIFRVYEVSNLANVTDFLVLEDATEEEELPHMPPAPLMALELSVVLVFPIPYDLLLVEELLLLLLLLLYSVLLCMEAPSVMEEIDVRNDAGGGGTCTLMGRQYR